MLQCMQIIVYNYCDKTANNSCNYLCSCP